MNQKKLAALLLVFVGFRYFIYFSTLQKLSEGHLRITGTIGSEPTQYDRSQRISLSGYDIYLPLHPLLSLGDSVVVEGNSQEGTIKKGQLVSSKEPTNPLYLFRKKILTFYSSTLPQDSAELVAGAVLGSKQFLTTEFWNALTLTGTAHVVVASGMNVTIVSKFILDVLIFFLPRRKAVPLSVAFIWLYALLAGLGAPIIRAAIMGSLTFTAQEFGKLSDSLRIFFITCVAMILVKPEWLWDISFLLTCTATLSIMLLQKPIEQKLIKVPVFFRGDLTTSLAASIGVSPILWWNFGQFNILSPIINALVLWTIAPITIIGGIGGIIGLVFPILGKVLLYLVYPFSWWFTFVIGVFS
jgi:competence protein ComEC